MGTAKSTMCCASALALNFVKKRSINFWRYSPGGRELVNRGLIEVVISSRVCIAMALVPPMSRSRRISASLAGSILDGLSAGVDFGACGAAALGVEEAVCDHRVAVATPNKSASSVVPRVLIHPPGCYAAILSDVKSVHGLIFRIRA